MSVFSLESDKKKIRSQSDPNIIGCVLSLSKGILSPVGTRGHATAVNNEIVMNLFMNLFLIS